MEKFSYGGQAVIEGVMMKGKHYLAVAVRRTDNQISIKEEALKSWSQKYGFLKKPVLRGVLALFEMLAMGMRCLSYSANEYMGEDEEPISTKEWIITIAFAVALTVGLFIMLPAYIIRFVQAAFNSDILLNLIEGLIKISFFVLYILAISWMKDIQRVFQYHGAEHKTINCYEADQPLTVENVRRFSTIHSRCGTNFVLIVLFMSVFIFTVFSSFFGRPVFLARVGIHLAIMPIVAGLSYEIIRAAGRPNCHPLVKLLAAPGRYLQLLTTRQPDDSQIEVAIQALQSVLAKDKDHPEERKIKQFPVA